VRSHHLRSIEFLTPRQQCNYICTYVCIIRDPASSCAHPHPIEFRISASNCPRISIADEMMLARCCECLPRVWLAAMRLMRSGFRILAPAPTPTLPFPPPALTPSQRTTLNTHIVSTYERTFAWPHFFSSIISNCERIFPAAVA